MHAGSQRGAAKKELPNCEMPQKMHTFLEKPFGNSRDQQMPVHLVGRDCRPFIDGAGQAH